MIRRWLILNHPDLWATRLPGMLASGLLLALAVAGYVLAMPLHLNDLRDPTPLFGWTAILAGLLSVYWLVAAILLGDSGPFRHGPGGWTAIWATVVGLAALNAAAFLGPELYEARIRAAIAPERLKEVGALFGEVSADRRLRAVFALVRPEMEKREEFLARVLGAEKAPDPAAADRLLALWERVPPGERTLPRAVRMVEEFTSLPHLPEFVQILEEFGPGLAGEYAEDRRESVHSVSGFLTEDNLRWAGLAYDDTEPSHPGEDPDTVIVYLGAGAYLALAVALARHLGLGLAAGASALLAFTWLGLRILLPIVVAESAVGWWESGLWLALWGALAAGWAPDLARGRRSGRAVAAFAGWLLLLPSVGLSLLGLFEHDDEVWDPLARASLVAPLLLAPLLQVVLNRFRGTPEGVPQTVTGPQRVKPARVNRLHRWMATHAPALREERLPGILGSGLLLTLVGAAYGASLPVSLTDPPGYEATLAIPWLLGFLLTAWWAFLLVRDASLLPVRAGAAGWGRLPLLALGFGLLTAAPFVASEVMDARLRALVPAERVAADREHLSALRKTAWPAALGKLHEWREAPSASPSRVGDLADALTFQEVGEAERARAKAILADWAATPLEERTWIGGAQVLARHEAWPGPEVPWQDLLATYAGDVETVLSETAGTAQAKWSWSRADSSVFRFAAAHALAQSENPPRQDRDELCAWLWLMMFATLVVAGVRAAGLRWVITAGVALTVLFVALGVLFGIWDLELGEFNGEDLALMAVLVLCAGCLGLALGILRRRTRTWRLCLLLAAGLLGAPFLPLLGMGFGIVEPDGGVPFWFVLAGNLLLLLAAPALQALLNLYRAAPGDGTA